VWVVHFDCDDWARRQRPAGKPEIASAVNCSNVDNCTNGEKPASLPAMVSVKHDASLSHGRCGRLERTRQAPFKVAGFSEVSFCRRDYALFHSDGDIWVVLEVPLLVDLDRGR
jgi:hypothetical protein